MADDNRKMRITAVFDTTGADASARKLNQTIEDIGPNANAAGQTASAAIDKLTASALRSQKVLDVLGPDLVAAGREAGTSYATAGARVDALTRSLKEQARQAQEAKRSGGPQNPATPDADKLNALFEKARRADEEAAVKRIDALIQASQLRELSGAQKIEAQRQIALKTLGLTDENVKRINTHFDQVAQKARRADEETAVKRIDALIAASQAHELTGAQKIEAQRQQALKTLGLTEENVKRINTHFDQLAQKAGNQELASKVRNFIQNPLASVASAAEAAVLGLNNIGVALLAVGLAGAALAAGLFKEGNALAAYGLEIQNLAARTGLTVEQTQLFNKAAEYAGVNAGALSLAVKKLNEDLAEGGTESVKVSSALDELGVKLRHTTDGTVDSGATVDQAFRALQQIPDYYKRAALAQELFGRGAKEFLPLIANYDQLNARAKEHLEILAGGEIKAIDQYRQSVIDLQTSWDNLVLDLIKKPAVATFSVVFKGLRTFQDFWNGLTAGGSIDEPGGITGVFERNIRDIQNKRAGEDTAEAAGLQSDDATKSLNARFPEGNVAALKKQLTVLSGKLKSQEADATNFLPGSTAESRATASAKFAETNRLIEQQKKLIEGAEHLATADKREATEFRAARDAREAAEAKDATGIRAIELQNGREREKALTSIGGEGTEFRDKASARVNAEFQKKLNADLAAEERKQLIATETERKRAADAESVQEIDAVKRSGRLDQERLKTQEAAEGASLLVIEDLRLAATKATIDRVEQLELARIRRHTAAEIDSLNRQLVPGLSKDNPALRQRQIKDLTDRQNLILGGGRAEEQRVTQDAADSTADATTALDTARDTRNRDARRATQEAVYADQTALLDHQKDTLRQSEAAELDSLRLVQTHTLSARLELDARRLQIETEYLQKEETLELDLLERQRVHQIKEAQADARRRGTGATEEAAIEKEIDDRSNQDKVLRAAQTQADIEKLQRESAIRAAQDIIDSQQRVFDTLKQQTESILDIAFGKSKHKGQDIAEEIKQQALKAAKDVIATQVAIAATAAATGKPVGQQTNTAGTGLAGILQRILGVKPVFGGLTPEQQAIATTLKSLKLEQAGSLGDAKLLQNGEVSVRVGPLSDVGLISGAVPVYVINSPTGDAQSRQTPAQAQQTQSLQSAARIGTSIIGALGGLVKGSGGGRNVTESVTESIDFGSGAQPLGGGGRDVLGLDGKVYDSAAAAGSSPAGSSPTQGSGVLGALRGILGGPGGTPPFAAQKGRGGIAGLKSTLGGSLDSLKGLIGFGSNGTYGTGKPGVGGAAGIDEGTGLAGGLKALGHSQAALLAGTALATDGIRRGGLTGLGETTAGGALIGFKYGGPIGAAIGAGVGAAVGTARFFWKTKAEETSARIKEKYGLRVPVSVAGQIADVAKQQYNGSIDAALQSRDVQQLLSAYSQETGGNYGIVGPTAATLAYSGQGLEQAGTYVNGKLLGFSSSLASLQPFDGTINSPTRDRFGQDPSSVTVSLDGPSSAAFLQGQTVTAIANNPAAVSNAGLQASSSSINRLQQTANYTNPLAVIA